MCLRTHDDFALPRIYDKAKNVIGANIVAGMLHVHCHKLLKDVHLLDAGCGTGQFAQSLIEFGVGKLTLLDSNPEMLNYAKKKLDAAIKGGKIDAFIENKLPNLPFESTSFDAILFSYVLQFLDTHDEVEGFPVIESVLKDSKGILKEDGVIIIATGLPSTVKESIWYTQIYPPIADKLAKTLPSTKDWLQMFEKCGFKCVSAMNFLLSDMVNHFDAEGPLNDEWIIGIRAFADANIHEIGALKDMVRRLKDQGLLNQFVIDHDHTLEMGMTTMFVCVTIK